MPVPTKRAGTPRPAAMVDVARLSGVSQKTVSRVVNGEPHVSPKVRLKVVAAIEELNFRPNSAARALASARSRTIGFVYTGSALFGPSSMSVGIERAARDAGYSVAVVHTPDGSLASVRAAFDNLIGRGVEGIVVSEPADDLRPADLPSNGIPVLSLEYKVEEDGDWLMVGADDRSGARAATEHLIALGHRSIGHIAGPQGWATSQNRMLGWQDALAKAGLTGPPAVRGDWSAASGFAAGQVLATTDITALLASNDEMAIGAMRALELAGRSIPQSVSVVGIDDIPLAAYLSVPLTTVRQDFDRVGREGMARLLELIAGRELESRSYAVPTELIVRGSTASPI
jgi:DNA-binding LacI/PurR family transcriptional regulator